MELIEGGFDPRPRDVADCHCDVPQVRKTSLADRVPEHISVLDVGAGEAAMATLSRFRNSSRAVRRGPSQGASRVVPA